MLASDREREATILRLRAAHLEGRIDTAELGRRVERAQQARTRDELDAVAVDVPERAAAVVETTHGMPRWPGRRHFTERKLLDSPPSEVREAMLMDVAPPLERRNFYLHRESPGELVFENRQSVGARVTVRLRDAGDGRTLVLVHGKAPLMVRRAFARLGD